MPRIGNVDHILQIMQQQLQKLDGTKKRAVISKSGRVANGQDKSSVRRVSEIFSRSEFSDEDFVRALVRAMLVDELGDGLSEDHRFDRLVAQVYATIAKDEKFGELLRDATKQARSGGKD